MSAVGAEARAKLRGRRVVASISGGKDSAALSLHLTELGIEHDRVFMDTRNEHASTYEHIRGPLTQKLGPITEISGPHSFEELIRRKGMFPSRVTRFCTTDLKVMPAKAHMAGEMEETDIVNAVGIRRAESKARSQMPEWEWSETFDCDVWRPLATWSLADVLAIHKRHGLALAPLYAMGASRVGCWPCIHARKEEIALVARIDPARIAEIDRLEREVNAEATARARAKGEELVHRRTLFSYGGGGRKHYPLPIYEAVEWANSRRGEWQPPGAAEGCMRHGLCEAAEAAVPTCRECGAKLRIDDDASAPCMQCHNDKVDGRDEDAPRLRLIRGGKGSA